jgi:ribosomal protein L11 methyltransferase
MANDTPNKAPGWNLVSLTIVPSSEEFASSLLFDLGTTGTITMEESADQLKLGAYFEENVDPNGITHAIKAEFARAGREQDLLAVSFSAVADADWMQKWKEGFEPTAIGEQLLVAPSWRLPADAEGREVIQIDPGMAFGTGTHETTRLCLELIERYWRGGSLLDVGTGTGILAIAAALLQPDAHIIAIDVDPVAVEVARENIAINRVTNQVSVLEEQSGNLGGQIFEVVVANLTAEVIVDLMGELANCVKPDGWMILSGILNELGDDVERSAAEAGLEITERQEAGEWTAVVARRRVMRDA